MLERKNKASVPQEVTLDAEDGLSPDVPEKESVIHINAYRESTRRKPGRRTDSSRNEVQYQESAAAHGSKSKPKSIRFNLTIPEPLYSELTDLATEYHTTELELMRTALRLAILGLKAQRVPGEGLVLCTGGTERLLLLP